MAQKIVLVIGSIWGRLTVLEQAEPLTYRRGGTFGATYEKHRAVCRCECGTQLIVRVDMLRSGHTRSCGCLIGESARARFTTHGQRNTPEWHIWNHAKQRCVNPRDKNYAEYGERGITMCERWLHSPGNFFEDMGPRPTPQHTLERRNNRLGYSPENCEWATRSTQTRNRRVTNMLTYNGKTLPLVEWADRLGMSRETLYSRVRRYGWSTEDALSIPPIPSPRRTQRR